MLQILIADDEKKIRQGLRNIVDWEALGYQIAGEAADGEEAVSFLAARRADVVLLDISMPKCNGLEVVRRAQEQGFSGKVIILSGYSDFKYAQEAIRLGVKFYLTKPIDEKELEQLLLQLKEEIAEESKKRAAATNYYQRARETILRDLFLKPGNVALLDLVDMNTAAVEYQVVLYERYVSQQKDMGFSFERFLRVNNQENHLFDLIELEQAQGVLLKGEGVIRRFHELLEQCAEQAANSLPTALAMCSWPMAGRFPPWGRSISPMKTRTCCFPANSLQSRSSMWWDMSSSFGQILSRWRWILPCWRAIVPHFCGMCRALTGTCWRRSSTSWKASSTTSTMTARKPFTSLSRAGLCW